MTAWIVPGLQAGKGGESQGKNDDDGIVGGMLAEPIILTVFRMLWR